MVGTRRAPPEMVVGDDRIDIQLANQWFTSCLSFFTKVFSAENEYYENLKGHYQKYPTYSDVKQAFGVLKAAKDDYESGALFELRSLLEAEIFDDFLEQAEHLLGSGYFQAAAVLGGCVLEDALRKICQKKALSLPSKPKLDSMNSELAKAGVYNKLTQKKITALADIRNSAAHGNRSNFNKQDVEDMLKSIRDFVEKNYT